MLFQVCGIGFRVRFEQGDETVVEPQSAILVLFPQYRTVGDVQDLAGIELLQQARP
jgi:hypothetical protein